MFGGLGKLQGKGAQPEPETTTPDVLNTSGLSFTGRIAGWSAAHRWWVVSASVLVMVLAVFVLNTVEVRLFEGDGGEGEAAIGAQLIDQRFDFETPTTEQLVFSNPSLNVNDPAYRATVEELVAELRALPEVASVESYYDTNAPGMVSQDGHVLLAQVVIDEADGVDPEEKIDAILATVRSANGQSEGFEIGIAGDTSIFKETGDIMDEGFVQVFMITIALGLVILLIAFRSAVAAVIPLILAIGSVFTAMAISSLVSHAYALADGYTEMILLMGMAVGIDYSLFIVSRFRSERRAGRSKLNAIAFASNTTGRAVFYAGVTVMLSLAGLALTSNTIFVSYALGAIVVVAIAVVGSLTLLPALLGILGDNVNRLRLPIIGRERGENNNGGIWGAISDRVQARPGIFATLTAGALIALAVPVLFLNLGFNTGADSLPNGIQSKRAVELLEEHFTGGLVAPAYVVVEAQDVNSPEIQGAVANLVGAVSNDARYFPTLGTTVNEAGDVLFVEVPIAGEIDGEEAENGIKFLRSDIVPAAFAGSDADVYVTGATAASVDFRQHMFDTAPYVFGFVLGLAFILLLIMFRSIVIPVKAIALNLLSAGAAYGVLVMVFQFGWGASLIGTEATGVIEAWLPLFLFGILFGLSMDYHMLLLNRIKEAHDEGHSSEESVSMGIKLTAGQITSAAIIMVGVFSAFALMPMVMMKQFGIGLAVAVFIDATVIRSVLLPATMKLLGDWNWYLPKWLEWLPRFSAEGAEREHGRAAFKPTPEPVPFGDD